MFKVLFQDLNLLIKYSLFTVLFQLQIGAREEALEKEIEEEVDDFFAKFDLKSAAVTKTAMKTIQRIEKQQKREF